MTEIENATGISGGPRRSDDVALRGICRLGDEGQPVVDAMAGRASVFGFGFEPIVTAIQSAARQYLGDGAMLGAESGGNPEIVTAFDRLLSDSTAFQLGSVSLFGSADGAIDAAICSVRHREPGRYRTIALSGSDHGRTALCRTASGIAAIREGFGPMMAGFSHVPPGDLNAAAAAIDEQSCAMLVAPVQLNEGSQPLQADYLRGIRELCDQHRLALIVDETQVCFGASGRPFSYTAIADVTADIVVASAGLFGGLGGGVLLASDRYLGDGVPHLHFARHPLLAAVLAATLDSLADAGLPHASQQAAEEFAVAIAERASTVEFVRDIHRLGMTIGVETDIESNLLVQAASKHGLRIESAGPTAFRVQPPIVMTDDDRQRILDALSTLFQAVTHETESLSV